MTRAGRDRGGTRRRPVGRGRSAVVRVRCSRDATRSCRSGAPCCSGAVVQIGVNGLSKGRSPPRSPELANSVTTSTCRNDAIRCRIAVGKFAREIAFDTRAGRMLHPLDFAIQAHGMSAKSCGGCCAVWFAYRRDFGAPKEQDDGGLILSPPHDERMPRSGVANTSR